MSVWIAGRYFTTTTGNQRMNEKNKLEDIVKLDIRLEIAKTARLVGLQATEDKIYSVYSDERLGYLRNIFLKELYSQYPFYKFIRR